MVTANDAFKDADKWYFEKIQNPGNDPSYCPDIGGVQTTVENSYECLIGTLPDPSNRPDFVYNGAFYYAAIFSPNEALCPYQPYPGVSGPVNLISDPPLSVPFIACLVAEIPTQFEHS